MLGIGLTITLQQLQSLRNAGTSLILGVLLQFTIMPLIRWLAATVLKLPPMLALGVILVIGWIKTYERLPFGIKPKSVTISRRADRWFISFKIEVELQQASKQYDAVGVGLGLLRFATLSNGEQVDSPRPFKALEKKLARTTVAKSS